MLSIVPGLFTANAFEWYAIRKFSIETAAIYFNNAPALFCRRR